jgi:hypothetical protein
MIWLAASCCNGCQGDAANATPDLKLVASVDLGVSDSAPDSRLDLVVAPDFTSALDLTPVAATLMLSLDVTLDGPDDAVKAATLETAELLAPNGAIAAAGIIVGSDAVFALAAVPAGDYFIEVNGDADDLVPTRIDDPTRPLAQRVGTTLRTSYVGPPADPIFRVRTYSAGQGQSPVTRYSDGTPIAGEQPYLLATLSFAAPRIEFAVLGTAAPLNTLKIAPTHQSPSDLAEPFDAWLVNTDGSDHHGDTHHADPAVCAQCHWHMDRKPPMFGAASMTNGWCYRCHYGAGGSDSGFVDPLR